MTERGLLGETLIELRESARLSQRGLAELSSISHGTIRNIELGKGHHRRMETLQQVAAGLATNADGSVDQEKADGYLQRLLTAAGKALMVVGPNVESPVEVPCPENPPLGGAHDVQEVHVTIVRAGDGSETVTVDVRGYDPLACGQAARQAICAAQAHEAAGGGNDGAGTGVQG